MFLYVFLQIQPLKTCHVSFHQQVSLGCQLLFITSYKQKDSHIHERLSYCYHMNE